MKRIRITHVDEHTFHVSGYGDSRYYQYASDRRDDIGEAIAFVQECWELYKEVEECDVLIELSYKKVEDPDERLRSSFDEHALRNDILKLRAVAMAA